MSRAQSAAAAVALLFVTSLAIQPCVGLPRPLPRPTPKSPFVFIHSRSAGGSSLRSDIYRSATKLKIKQHLLFIPTFGNTGAFNWRKPPFTKKLTHDMFAVYAGHFAWSTLRDQVANPLVTKWRNFTALANVRDPVGRVISCINHRIGHHILQKDPREFEHALLNTYSAEGIGCNNELVRMLSGYSDELEVNHLALTPDKARALVGFSIEHLREFCVVHPLEAELQKTREVVRHWFPWLRLSGIHLNSKMPQKRTSISPQILEVIERLNAPEIEVYQAAMELFEEQLQYSYKA
eukprot:CAMPEP_0117654792 /NCGR_PEP_ID=MMETSP0804-20121206/3935_1 /TAXON_ID=1074897 /ORGANISM="Tetraselmis astigmatica, Strain CCMP880" /LENGTH=292 /DNA_ID=CAMNT_0005461101 /DNA_START=29 /DNA_END=907 /DNA_ORIENTATION=+